ncbi:hypothetical protein COCNU_scaffold093141G000010 [Cocos nucifera]|nr:hypothetical protein [Cocos nucifera]
MRSPSNVRTLPPPARIHVPPLDLDAPPPPDPGPCIGGGRTEALRHFVGSDPRAARPSSNQCSITGSVCLDLALYCTHASSLLDSMPLLHVVAAISDATTGVDATACNVTPPRRRKLPCRPLSGSPAAACFRISCVLPMSTTADCLQDPPPHAAIGHLIIENHLPAPVRGC